MNEDKVKAALMEDHEIASKETNDFLKSADLTKDIDFDKLTELTIKETEALAESLREYHKFSCEKTGQDRDDAMLWIGEKCGESGLSIRSIVCPRPEFEQRKSEGNL